MAGFSPAPRLVSAPSWLFFEVRALIIDFRNLDDQPVIEADLCIIGAGAAGITLAREFLTSTLRVVVIESGGFELEADTQSLYRGESVGRKYYPLDSCRLRFF